MKVVKGLATFSFFCILFGSCFDPPEFPIVPEISFPQKPVVFRDITDSSKPDSLILYINFKDGDGDLGLDPENPDHRSNPYHNADFFQSNATGGLTPVTTEIGTITGADGKPEFIDVIKVSDPAAGDLVFPRTKIFNSQYSDLPDFNCVNYDYKTFIVAMADKAILDDFTVIEDTLSSQGLLFLLVSDSLYMQSNPNHYNIEVDFLVKQGDGTFDEFDWREEFCSTFDGRFPVLADSESALDGTLKYNMESRGFNILFGGKILKLRVQIKDRERHLSNTIETQEFTLQSIRED